MGEERDKMDVIDFKKFKLIELSKLVKADWNYKEDDEDLKQKLINNMNRSGQVENIIVRKIDGGKYEIVNGNHRLDCFKEMGVEKAICCDMGKISVANAKRLANETNETKFRTDEIKLAENIKDILEEFTVEELAETMPYSIEELENFTKLLDFNWDQYGSSDSPLPSEGFRNLSFNLPESIADQFEQQIDRLKGALHPGVKSEDINKISYVIPIEAIVQHIALIPDEHLVG
jgi:hypothetical protein